LRKPITELSTRKLKQVISIQNEQLNKIKGVKT